MQDFGFFQTQNKKMIDTLELIDSVSTTWASLLICGEPGVGKSTMVQHIMNKASASQKFVTWSPEIKAIQDGTTVLVDSVESLKEEDQLSLILALEKARDKKLRFRTIATTQVNLNELVKSKKFRQDLYYRLAVIVANIPSLSERKEDIALLAKIILDSVCFIKSEIKKELSRPALEALLNHRWSGNVAELENVMERAVHLSPGLQIELSAIQFAKSSNFVNHDVSSSDIQLGVSLQAMEQKLILQTLQVTQQNRTRAAEILGISIRTLRNKINEYKELGVL